MKAALVVLVMVTGLAVANVVVEVIANNGWLFGIALFAAAAIVARSAVRWTNS